LQWWRDTNHMERLAEGRIVARYPSSNRLNNRSEDTSPVVSSTLSFLTVEISLPIQAKIKTPENFVE
jgi:hypothetical protein